MGMPLRNRTPAAAPAAATTRPTPDPEAPLPDTPEQGSAGDGSQFIPPPPVTPNGTYRMRFVKVNTWEKADGTIATDSKGNPSKPVLLFEITDPREAEKNRRGLESCYGEEVTHRIEFAGKWAAQTDKFLTHMGVGRSTWPTNPKTPKNPGGMPTPAQLWAHVNKLAGREFVVTVKATAGKGENKDRVFVNIDRIERYTPPARPAPAKPPPRAEEPPGEDAPPAEAGGDDIPF